MSYLGDFASGSTVRGKFNTRQSDGTPITLAGSPTLAIYKDSGTTESTAGVTLTVDFDGRTGLHDFVVVLSDAFYAAGSNYQVVLTAGTVDGVSVVGVVVGSFSIENRSALRPTVAGRTLDVTSAGTVTVSAFSGSADTDITALINTLDAVEARLPAALINGRIDAHVGAMAANTLTASALATDAVNEIALQTAHEVFAYQVEGIDSFGILFAELIYAQNSIDVNLINIKSRLPLAALTSTDTISASNTDRLYSRIATTSGNALNISGSHVSASADFISATGVGGAALSITGNNVRVEASHLYSASYDCIILAGTNTRATVVADRIHAGSDAIALEGTNNVLTVNAKEIFCADAINFESTGGRVHVSANRIEVSSELVLVSSGTAVRADIFANYIRSSSFAITAGDLTTITIHDAVVDGAVVASSGGTLELRNCVVLGNATQSGTGVIRYDALTQFRGSVTGTLTPIGFAASTLTASALATDAVNEIVGAVFAYSVSQDDFFTVMGNLDNLQTNLAAMLELDGNVHRWTANALEQAPAGGGGGDASQATLLLVKAKTDLISAGTVTVNSPTTATGSVRPIVIGDDYLAANGRAFAWTISAISGITPATATAYFGGTGTTTATSTFLVTGTVTDNGNGTWTIRCDMTAAVSATLTEQQYEWTLGIQAAGGTRVTPVRWGERVQAVESHTW